MTKDEYIQRIGQSIVENPIGSNGCMPTIMYCFIIAAFVICTMCSCKTTTSTEQTVDYRHMARISERMDSLFRATETWQKSVYEKQTSLVESFKNSEVRDTSHTIFLGAKGDTVKETIVIKQYIESNHSSQESTQELREEFFRQTDSIIALNKTLSEKVDSFMQSHNKETVVEKEVPWYEKFFNGIRNILAWVALILIGYTLFRWKKIL